MQRIRNHLNILRHLSWPSYGKKCSADKKGTHSIFHSVNIIHDHVRLLLNLTFNNNSYKRSYLLNIVKILFVGVMNSNFEMTAHKVLAI